MTKYFKKFIFNIKNIFIILVFFLITTTDSALAALDQSVPDSIKNQTKAMTDTATINTSMTIGSVLQTVISAFLGMMGIVFLILILVAGYKYMMDGGEGKNTKVAMDSIRHAVIGLIIVVSAYAITKLVFDNLEAVNNTTSSMIIISQILA